MRNVLMVVLCSLVLALPASAQWSRIGSGGATYFVDVSAPAYKNVVILGFEITGSGFSTAVKPKVFASEDAGRTLKDVSGTLDDASTRETPRAVVFVDVATGWVSIGRRVFRTTNGGTTWTGSDLGFEVLALGFADALHGVAAGAGGQIRRTTDGGASWATVTSPVSTDLHKVFVLDADRAWMAGYSENEETMEVTGGVLVRSTDGGASWTKGADLGSVGVSSLAFLCDGTTGYVGAWKVPGEDRVEAALLRTTDGGATVQDTNVPLQVGTVQAFGTQPVKTGKLLAMHWEDAKRARLAGLAFLGKKSESQSGGGSSTSTTSYIWRVVDYATHDGGATWQKTDLGNIPFSITNPPAGDGGFFGGTMWDLDRGWLVGAANTVWGVTKTCVDTAACGEAGYLCWRGECVAEGVRGCAVSCEAGTHSEGGECVPDETGEGSDGGSTATPGRDGGSAGGDGGEDDGLSQIGDSCSCGAGGAGSVALVALAIRRRRARR